MAKRKVRKTRKKEKAPLGETLSKNLRESAEYIKESRKYIYFIIALFFFSGVIGYLFPDNFTFFNELIEGLTERTTDLGPLELIWFILQNNVVAAFFGMLFGVFLGAFPVFAATLNGVLLGYVFSIASQAAGFGVAWMLVPHGIFELPAIFIALGLGVKLGMTFFTEKKDRFAELHVRLWKSLKVFFLIVLPLLVVAAVIEGLLIFYS
jgi:stage II sporulation protein M